MCEVHVPLDQGFEAQKADFFGSCDFFVHNVSEGRLLLASHKGGDFAHLREGFSLSSYAAEFNGREIVFAAIFNVVTVFLVGQINYGS